MPHPIRPILAFLLIGFAFAARLSALDFGEVRATAVAPSDPSVVYAAGTGGVFATSDSGALWAKRSDGPGVLTLAVDPSDPRTVWAGAGDPYYSPAPHGLFRSRDGAATWTPVAFAPDSWPVYAIAFQPGSPSTILIGTSVGLYRSTDVGASWSLVTTGFLDLTNVFAIAFSRSQPSVVYAGSAYLPPGAGVYRSTDAGATWTILPSPVPNPDVRAIAVDPADADTMYRSDYSVGVSKTTDGGQHWTLVLPVRAIVAFAVDPDAPGTVYAGAESDFGTGFPMGGVFKTTDGGATWNVVAPGFLVQSLAVDPSHPARLYAGTERGFGNLHWNPAPPGLYQTEDSGATWRLAGQGECAEDLTALCLNAGRFRVGASWRTPDGASGDARPIANTTDTGTFWFFSVNNVELVVKIVDGRAVNGQFWVFGGQLTDVEYTMTITDTQTGTVWTHHNAQGTLASFADTSAFGP